ncbi:RagB/SusD family nutrient uptake outer membrane protein [Parapedobacter pyrenivorans]|nr:RagB/SusD family nutrient uptake outer membrane protein [Parapedobacter pyrenivorans]
MKSLMKIMAACFLLGITSCNYLDVVPNDTATLDHAFSNRSVMEKFMRTCYSHLPDPTNPWHYPAYFTSRDEFDWRGETRAAVMPAAMISRGLQNTNTPYQDYWSGTNGAKAMYTAIRDCNIFLESAHIPRDIDETERLRWISEVTFLKAYYHFFLVQLYGPIVLVRENLPVSASPEEAKVYREPVDECIEYIVELLDEAAAGLPDALPDPSTERGRITKITTLGIKAKALAWAASPLFNGNPDYAGWVDNRGKQLIPNTYDATKWERAAIAIREAIDLAEATGHRLYEFNKFAGGASTFAMNDTLETLMTVRKAITEQYDQNPGVLWATQEQFAHGKGSPGLSVLGNMLASLFPVLYSTDQPLLLNYMSASWHMAELYYTNNGVPINEDKNYDYSNRFSLRRATPSDNHESYIATNEVTSYLHFFREPRFYASLGIDRGYFELVSTTTNGGASFGPVIKSRSDEVGPANGHAAYTPKKIIPFESSGSRGIAGQVYTQYLYQFPLLRLADLYLLYAEALNEVKAQPDQDVYLWIDKIREQTGLDGVVESWQRAAYNPGAPSNKNDMRRIIQRERLIELSFEGQRFWDVRRWKIAQEYWTLPPTSWKTGTRVAEEFYVPTPYAEPRQVTFRDYLYPLRQYDLRVNTNLVQTYGW